MSTVILSNASERQVPRQHNYAALLESCFQDHPKSPLHIKCWHDSKIYKLRKSRKLSQLSITTCETYKYKAKQERLSS